MPGKGHAFDIYEKSGGEVHAEIIIPAVEWVAALVFEPTNQVEASLVEPSMKYYRPGRSMFRFWC